MKNNNKILIWIIALLAVLNLTIIGSIFYHKAKEKEKSAAVVLDQTGRNPLNGKYFRNTLGFDEEQMEVFRSANREFRSNANTLLLEMDSLKSALYIELNKNQPDSVKLNQLSDEIGKDHASLKKTTNQFYLKMLAISNPEQKEQLQNTFKILYEDKTINMRQGNGRHRFASDSTGLQRGYRRHQNK